MAREELREFEGRIQINYLTDLSPDELVARTANLPERSIVLFVFQQARDYQGKLLESEIFVTSITRTTPVPIFGMSVHLVGHGIIGGDVYTVEAAAGQSGRNGAKNCQRRETPRHPDRTRTDGTDVRLARA